MDAFELNALRPRNIPCAERRIAMRLAKARDKCWNCRRFQDFARRRPPARRKPGMSLAADAVAS